MKAMGTIAIAMMASACSVQMSGDRTYTLEIDEKAPRTAVHDKAIEADRRLEQLALGTDLMGMAGPRLVAFDPIGDVREGIVVTHDLRMHTQEKPSGLAAMPGVDVKRTIEITDRQGGRQMLEALTRHPVLLTRMRFDCRMNTVADISYHAADAYTAPFAFTFNRQDPKPEELAGRMREVACSGMPKGLNNSRDTMNSV